MMRIERAAMLTTAIERKGSTTIIRCVGRIVVGEELSQLRDAVLCELGQQTIVLDLRAVEAIDAGGLGLFVFLHTCAHGLGTELKLRNPPQRMAELLRLTNLDFVLEIFPSENVVPRHAAVARATDDTDAYQFD
jgi:anti-sigma B factor antagonist